MDVLHLNESLLIVQRYPFFGVGLGGGGCNCESSFWWQTKILI